MSAGLEIWEAFANDYNDGRQRFIAQAQRAGAALSHYAHPTLSTPDGQPLTLDVARLGPADATRTLLLISGTHGLEGAAGSAVQNAWLASQTARDLPPDTNVLLVHALNPFGWSHDTRTNESNVDLNRNFIDHAAPRPSNTAYDTLHAQLVPDNWTATERQGVQNAIQAFREVNGPDATFNAMASGQYRHAQGLAFGGQQREWSNLTLERILGEHLAHTERVALIDWHTGIGEYGEPFFLCFNADGSEEQQQAAQWWSHERVLGQRPHGMARPDYQGLVFRGVEAFLPGRKVAGAVIEFGTRGTNTSESLRLDQWLRFRAPQQANAARDAQLRHDLIDTYVPYSGVWRQSVLRHGVEITDQALHGLAQWN